ncbi:hypothetical protein PoHVEF18_009859 [Penicillium ochrochloron]
MSNILRLWAYLFTASRTIVSILVAAIGCSSASIAKNMATSLATVNVRLPAPTAQITMTPRIALTPAIAPGLSACSSRDAAATSQPARAKARAVSIAGKQKGGEGRNKRRAVADSSDGEMDIEADLDKAIARAEESMSVVLRDSSVPLPTLAVVLTMPRVTRATQSQPPRDLSQSQQHPLKRSTCYPIRRFLRAKQMRIISQPKPKPNNKKKNRTHPTFSTPKRSNRPVSRSD